MSKTTFPDGNEWWLEQFTQRELDELKGAFQNVLDVWDEHTDVISVELPYPRHRVVETLPQIVAALEADEMTDEMAELLKHVGRQMAEYYISDNDLEPDDDCNEAVGWLMNELLDDMDDMDDE
jgi:hypothetical protein